MIGLRYRRKGVLEVKYSCSYLKKSLGEFYEANISRLIERLAEFHIRSLLLILSKRSKGAIEVGFILLS